MTEEEQIELIAKELQQYCHKTTERILKENPTADIRTCQAVWNFKKHAEYEIRLQRIESLLAI
ncbi:hypothetical protein [uncultured Winogradskyella sp.]|uniref:hypothetical protein n=1 Tax=uncultured Winogradskyella sp. TaxID=395353 RepID=UPI00262DE588|nr:hypothetical protein [uncultured Winogradskyella sp.]